MALLRLGPVLLQLASNPLAWFGTAAVAAAQANASGMSAGHSLSSTASWSTACRCSLGSSPSCGR
jgi:hypothetical protein